MTSAGLGDLAIQMQVDRPAAADVAVWAELWPSVRVFCACATQWRWHVGMSATVTGLDYVALQAVLRLQGVARKEWPRVFEDVQIMERAALPLLNSRGS